MGVGGEGEVAEALVEGQAVIGRLRFGEAAKLIVLAPVEGAAVDHTAADGGAVAGKELGGRVHGDVGAPFERPAKVGGGHGVVDDERDASLPGDDRQGLQIAHHAARIGQALGEDGLTAGGEGPAHRLRLVHVDEDGVPVELLEGLAELGDGAAVEPVGAEEAVTRLHEDEEGEDLGGVAPRRSRCRRARPPGWRCAPPGPRPSGW